MKAKNKRPKEEPKTKKEKRTILRVPRPMGITALCQQHNQGSDGNTNPSPPPNKEIKKRIQRLYINAFMNHQLIEYDLLTKDYKLMGINRLAYLLNTSTTEIMNEIAKEYSRMGLIMDRHKADVARGAVLRLFFESAELSALTSQQTAILMASQGGTYKPFISGEVNRAIGNQIAAMKPKLDLMKLLLDGKSSSNGPGLPVEPGAAQQGKFMTIEMAHNMLNDTPLTVMSDSATRDHILTNSTDLKLIPETNPNYQGGDILRSSSLYQGTEEELKTVQDTRDHTEKNKARNSFEAPLSDEDFLA